MRISAIEARALPVEAPSARGRLALAISAEDGGLGWAGIPAVAAGGLEAGPVPALAGLVGADARAIDAITADLRDPARGGAAALAGPVDVALHDLKARSLGVPVDELLGGRYRDRVRVHGVADLEGPSAPTVPGLIARKVRVRIDAVPPAGRIAEARRLREAIGAIDDRLADDAELIVAIEGRAPLATLLAVVRALDEVGPERIEVDDAGPEDLAAIAAATRTPIAHGAGLVGAAGLLPALERHLTPIVVVDVAANGFSEARRMADLAAHFDAMVVPADAADPLGLLTALAFSASQPTASMGFAVTAGGAGFAGYDAEAPPIEDGAIIVPGGAGLGAAPSGA